MIGEFQTANGARVGLGTRQEYLVHDADPAGWYAF